MKKIITIVFSITLIISFDSCSKKDANRKPSFIPSNQQLTSFEAKLDNFFNDLKIPGLSAALVNNQNVVWSKNFGFADVENKILPDENTVYYIGAMTNIFIPIIVLQLMEKEKLDLNDYVSQYGIKSDKNTKIKHFVLCMVVKPLLYSFVQKKRC